MSHNQPIQPVPQEDQRTPDQLASDKLRAEIAKLDSEIRDAQWNAKIGRYASLASPLVTAALTLLGVYFGAWQFKQSLISDQDKFTRSLTSDHDKLQQQLTQDRELKRQEREHDFLKSFSASQSTTYFALCQATGTIAAFPITDPQSKPAMLKFVQLYRGDARIVGDDAVVIAMDKFYGCLNGSNAVCRDPVGQINRLRDISYELSDACRASMARTSETDITQVKKFEDLFRVHQKDEVKGE